MANNNSDSDSDFDFDFDSSDSSHSDEDIALLLLAVGARQKRKRRHWVHPINQSRKQQGEFFTLYPLLRDDPERFYQYFRMQPEQFDYLHARLRPSLLSEGTNYRESIDPEHKLAVTIR